MRPLALLVLGLCALTLALSIGTPSAQPQTAIGDAWVSTPVPQLSYEAYGEGFNDGYLAACREKRLSC
jgi:hypothetical protein